VSSRKSTDERVASPIIDDLTRDWTFAWRQTRRNPLGAAVIVLTLGIGIGANATMAGTIDRLLLRAPVGVESPEDVRRILFRSHSPGVANVGKLANYPMLRDLERNVTAFAAVAGYAPATLSLGTGADAIPVRATVVSPSFFSLLRTRASLGRFFAEADGFPTGLSTGGPPVVVLSDGFWRRQFASDPRVVGTPLRIGRNTYSIVAVAPPGFRGVEVTAPDVWLPMPAVVGTRDVPVDLTDRRSVWLSIITRLRPGTTNAAAELEATTTWRTTALSGDRDSSTRVLAASVILGRGPDAPREVRVTLWLSAVSLLVLLLVIANVSSILLGRAFARRQEIAVRCALGASGARLARQVVVEAVLLSCLGGVAAIVFAAAGGSILGHVFVTDLGGAGFVDVRLLLTTGAIAFATGAMISLAPARHASSEHLLGALTAGKSAGGGRTSRARTGLLIAQAALCTVMLIGAGLFALSLHRVQSLDLGVDLDHTLVARFDIGGLALSKQAMDTAFDEVLRRVRSVPGVANSAFAQGNPYRGGRAVAVHTTTHDQDFFWNSGAAEIPMLAAVGAQFFRTVGARSLRGRDFRETDTRDAPPVAVINEPLARILWPHEEPLGQCIYLPVRASDRGGSCATVIGVLRGFWKYDILNRDVLAVYIPLAQQTLETGASRRPGALFIRATGDPRAIVGGVRRAIQGARSNLPAVAVSTMNSVVEPEVRPWRLAATMFTLFGAIALTVAAIGLFAVVSFVVTHRSREVAVRLALGAPARSIVRAVAGDAMFAIVIGLCLGVCVGALAARWVGPLLFQTSPYDARIFASGAGVLLGIASLAAAIPLAAALRQDPAAVLRSS
jgi:putative ABC transport system permease protein